MDDLDYWRWCDELSVIQAALLSVGISPSSEAGANCEEWKPHERPSGYEGAKNAIKIAFLRGKVSGNFVPYYEIDINGNICGEVEGSINIKESTVDVDSLKEWLSTKGLKPEFFFPCTESTSEAEYLNPNHARYSKKLAASINAWLSFSAIEGKTTKGTLDKWLRENAAKFDLTDLDGLPINAAIEDCSKIANWDTLGGVPKTPSKI